ncbi:MAG: PAS domain S-box protein [Oscillochloris sp.]|nr:PAS domain S-box protein [Oscillochloris sp.]
MLSDDSRMAQIADTLARLAGGQVVSPLALTGQGDVLDRLIDQVNQVGLALARHQAIASAQEQRIEELVDVIGSMAALDFSHTASVGEEGSLIDALAMGVNMLSEELAASTVSRSDMDRVIESMLDALVVVGDQGVISKVNRAASRMFGRSADDLVHSAVNTLFVDSTQAEQIAARVAREGAVRRIEVACYGAEATIPVSIAASALEDAFGDLHGIVYILRDISERKQAEAALRQSIAQEETIRAQAAMLAELSTPLIPISEEVVVMPLIGALDTRRTQQVTEALLEGITSTSASVAILDITGVPVVDTQVANGLIRAAQAVRLLGTQVILTGIRPEVAQTLVGLGVDLRGMITHSTLQSGIAAVLGHR